MEVKKEERCVALLAFLSHPLQSLCPPTVLQGWGPLLSAPESSGSVRLCESLHRNVMPQSLLTAPVLCVHHLQLDPVLRGPTFRGGMFSSRNVIVKTGFLLYRFVFL